MFQNTDERFESESKLKLPLFPGFIVVPSNKIDHEIKAIEETMSIVTNSMAYGTRRFNAAFTRASNNPYPESNQPNSSN